MARSSTFLLGVDSFSSIGGFTMFRDDLQNWKQLFDVVLQNPMHSVLLSQDFSQMSEPMSQDFLQDLMIKFEQGLTMSPGTRDPTGRPALNVENGMGRGTRLGFWNSTTMCLSF